MGAATAAYHLFFKKDRIYNPNSEKGNQVFYGPEFSDTDIITMSRRYKAKYNYYDDLNELYKLVSQNIFEGKVIGWFQGRMEFGPRALGNRSIIGNPLISEMQKEINIKVKFREGFRPFAPSVLQEDTSCYFDNVNSSPFMLFVADVRQEYRKQLPQDYSKLDLMDKLYVNRSEIPAVTHVDFSARVQTVSKEFNEKFWNLINNFKMISNHGLLINTSFNIRGEPIVCSPEDAYRCFMGTNIDFLVINNFVFSKKDQPNYLEDKNYAEKFNSD